MLQSQNHKQRRLAQRDGMHTAGDFSCVCGCRSEPENPKRRRSLLVERKLPGLGKWSPHVLHRLVEIKTGQPRS